MGPLRESRKWRSQRFSRIGASFQLLLCAFIAMSVVFVSGCARQASPDLLEITRVGPSTLESGSEVLIIGSGFPDGRHGTLFLEGTVHAPARRTRSVAWHFPLVAKSQGEINLRLDARELSERLQGAAHSTFRGDARIEFEAIKRGHPILKGSKNKLVLDFFGAGSADGESKDEHAFISFLGAKIDDDLTLVEVSEDGAASRAGLQSGDRLMVLDGVRLDSARDLLPQAASHSSTIEVVRPGERAGLQMVIDRRDFQLFDLTMAARAIAVLGGVLLALVWAARPPRFFLWLLGDRAPGQRTRRLWISGLPENRQLLAFPVFFLVLSAYFWVLVRPSDAYQGAAFVASLALGAFLLLLSSFLLGGARSRGGGFSFTGALASTFLRSLLLIPVGLAVFSRASEVGSLRLTEIASHQSALPMGWGLFASPWSFVLGLSFLVALLPLGGRRAPLYGHSGSQSTSRLIARVIEWTGSQVLLGLWIIVFLGGSQGGAPGSFSSGALLSAKLALIAHALCWAQDRSGGLRLGEAWSLFGLPQLLVSILVFSLGFAATFLGFSARHSELLGLFAFAMALSSALLLAVSSQRSWSHRGRHVDLWI